MGKRLAVILGAGASYDCTAIGVTRIDQNYRPPLTSGIFEGRKPFQTILEKYPKARTLASTIAIRVNRGEALEAVLGDLRDSKEAHLTGQFRQIPLYLQDLFGEISIHYTSEPTNYSYLVNRLLGSDFEKVAFVTLNYDLLLEKSLGTITSGPGTSGQPNHMSFYFHPASKWMLIKLHGSVNWARMILTQPNLERTHEGVLKRVDSIPLPLEQCLSPDVFIMSSHQQRWKELGESTSLFYPAISVPVEGKYEFVCPSEHVEALKSFFSSCGNYLLVGVSGRDKDLTDLLKANVRECALLGIVEGNAKAAEEVAPRFYNLVPQFRKAKEKKIYEEGFSGFTTVRGRSLEDFLILLK